MGREASRRQNGQNNFDIVCDKSGGASFWLCHIPGRQLFAPLDVSIVDSAGRELTRNSVITNLNGGLEFDFGTNFDAIGNDGGDNPSPVQTPTSAPVSKPTRKPTKKPTKKP